MGGHLATIPNDDTNDFTAVELARPFPTVWIGLRRNPNDPETFVLPDGRESAYTKWDENEPKEFSADGVDCVAIQSEDVMSSWRVIDCQARLPYICERGERLCLLGGIYAIACACRLSFRKLLEAGDTVLFVFKSMKAWRREAK